MSFAFVAQIVFYVAYFVAWLVNELPHTTWVTVSAIAAIVVAILLLVDNRTVIVRNRPVA